MERVNLYDYFSITIDKTVNNVQIYFFCKIHTA